MTSALPGVSSGAPSPGKPGSNGGSAAPHSPVGSSSANPSAAAGHGQSATVTASGSASAAASAAASSANGGGTLRAHVGTTFTITADGFSSSDTIDFGETATLAETGIPGSTGTVTFASGGATLCVATLSVGTSCTTDPTLAVGDYPGITGTYSTDSSVSTNQVDLTVDGAGSSTTSVTDSQNNQPYGTPIGFTVIVAPTDGDGTVSLFADGSPTAITGCADLTLSQVSGGSGSLFRAFRPHVGGIAHVVGPVGEYSTSCSPSSLPAGTDSITAVTPISPPVRATSTRTRP